MEAKDNLKKSVQEVIKCCRELRRQTQSGLSQNMLSNFGEKCAPETICRFEQKNGGVVLTVPMLFRLLSLLKMRMFVELDSDSENGEDVKVFEVDIDRSI